MNTQSNSGNTALIFAFRNGHANVAAYLIDQGAHVSTSRDLILTQVNDTQRAQEDKKIKNTKFYQAVKDGELLEVKTWLDQDPIFILIDTLVMRCVIRY